MKSRTILCCRGRVQYPRASSLRLVPLAAALVWLRVAGTGLASEWISPAVADGFFHAFSGRVAFVVTCLALVLLQRTLGWQSTWHLRVPAGAHS